MVSHAWDEYYRDFALAIQKAGLSGPFWICAFAIYQPEDMSELTIAKQLGSDPCRGPFTSVLKAADVMLCIVTSSCDIYTRMWCVFEMYEALQLGPGDKLGRIKAWSVCASGKGSNIASADQSLPRLRCTTGLCTRGCYVHEDDSPRSCRQGPTETSSHVALLGLQPKAQRDESRVPWTWQECQCRCSPLPLHLQA